MNQWHDMLVSRDSEALIPLLKENPNETIENLLATIDHSFPEQERIELLNWLATVSFTNELCETVIPFLEKALTHDETHSDTLFNLATVLNAFGEWELALHYAERIQPVDEEVQNLLTLLQRQKIDAYGVQNVDQDQVEYTGERIVINKKVKESIGHILEEHLKRYELACHFVKDKFVLDAACGTGYGSKMLAQAGARSVVGLDISYDSIKHAIPLYSDHNVSFVQGDIHQLPFEDETFDVVVSFETIEHIPDGSLWFKEASRVLKKGGLFIVSTPNRRNSAPGTYIEEAPKNPYHCFEYNIVEFLGEMVAHFDLIGFFGQTFINDHVRPEHLILRMMNHLDVHRMPKIYTHGLKHELVPMHMVKNAEPAYVVGIGRKR
jgi:2-polyprenyl-3-methyl-5-hydroxy-6-metoxy-1,4-benzoquinol methylase